MDDSDLNLPTYKDVIAAAVKLDGVAHRTPVMTSRQLEEELAAVANGPIKVFVKCENFQRMGAFKFRGGYTAMSNFTEEEKKCGVLTFSSGNHAQAIALSATILGMQSTIIMPKDAPELKIQATKEYGGNVVLYDRYTEDREVIAKKIQEETGATIVPPYDHFHVIAGQGTSAKELFEDVEKDTGSPELDYLLVCVGGGGLISGCSLAAKALSPNCKVIGVEPEAGNDAQQSLSKGEIVHIDTPKTIADGAQTQHIGKMTFAIMRKNVDSIVTVSDDELIQCMKFLGERMKMVVEPTGCLGLAGLKKLVKEGTIKANSRVGVIISGGNVDMKRYCDLIALAK